MVIRKKIKKDTCSKNNILGSALDEGLQALGGLGFLSGGNTIFSGQRTGLKIGDKAIVKGAPVNMKGHAPAAKFATLSDGSKIKLVGPNKGLIFK